MTANPDELIQAICWRSADAFGVHRAEIKGTAKSGDIVKARRLAMSLARNLTGLSFEELGLHFNRTHGAISNACQAMTKLLSKGNNPDALHFHELRNRLGNAPACPEAKTYF